MGIPDEEVLARLPGIRIDRDNVGYYRGLLERRLLLNRCEPCGTWHHPPRASCPKCWSWDVAPAEVSGEGTVYLFSFINGAAAHDDPAAPYPVVCVELPEGVRFTTTMVNCAKDDLAIGMPVKLAWIEQDGMPFPAVTPAQPQDPR
ncbi:MAG TPA: OB-fold domain-containing protein [Phenylobacterium sp.]|nr:OB-fold domain-containing protein [Phenylobacterium sp.]